jgi:hypothetical protein
MIFVNVAVDDCVRNAEWQHFYFLNNPYFERAYDIDNWLLGLDTWVIANHRPDSLLLKTCSTNQVLEYLSDSRVCGLAVINIHPEYVSDGLY